MTTGGIQLQQGRGPRRFAVALAGFSQDRALVELGKVAS